jgi:hypothetical protein
VAASLVRLKPDATSQVRLKPDATWLTEAGRHVPGPAEAGRYFLVAIQFPPVDTVPTIEVPFTLPV